MYRFYTHLICSIIRKRGLVELASFYRAIRGCSYHQHALNRLTHRFRHYMNPIYTPFAYNGHARVLLFTIPSHTKPSVGSKTPRIAPLVQIYVSQHELAQRTRKSDATTFFGVYDGNAQPAPNTTPNTQVVRSVSKGTLSTSISCPLSSYLHYPKSHGRLQLLLVV